MSDQAQEPNALLPLLPLRDTCLFPGSSLELVIARTGTLKALEIAARCGGHLIAAAQKDPDQVVPGPRDFHSLGTIATIVTVEPQPNDSQRVVVDGGSRVRLVNLLALDTVIAEGEIHPDGDPGEEWGPAVEALARYLHTHPNLRSFLEQQRRSSEPMAWVNLACQHLPITASARQKLLEANAIERCLKISRGLDALLRKEQGA